MFEVKVHIEIPALDKLADAIMANRACKCADKAPAAAAVQAAAPAAAPAAAAPVQTVPPAPVSAPVTAAPTPAASMPAAPIAPAPQYTIEQLSRAGADLVGQNPARMPELLALLQQFGVQAVQALRPEQIGAFATALRGLGAKI